MTSSPNQADPGQKEIVRLQAQLGAAHALVGIALVLIDGLLAAVYFHTDIFTAYFYWWLTFVVLIGFIGGVLVFVGLRLMRRLAKLTAESSGKQRT